MRIGVVCVQGLPPLQPRAVLRTEQKLNEELAELLSPENNALLRQAEVEFDMRVLGMPWDG